MPLVEIACDESGFTGGNLTAPNGVFAHATISLAAAPAAAVIRQLRDTTRAPDGELKANWLLRPESRPAVRWFLDQDGPLGDRAQVHLTDSRYFLLARILDVLLGDDPVRGTDLPGRSRETRSLAALLAREGAASFGESTWHDFLERAGNLVRMNRRGLPASAVEDFEDMLAALMRSPVGAGVRAALGRLEGRGVVAARVRQAYRDDPRRTPLLEPLLPALTRAVLRWGAAAEHVVVAHDEQSVLTPARLVDIAGVLAAARPGHRLTVRRLDSQREPRIQVADLVAGIARRAGRVALAGRLDPELIALVLPYVDDASVWVDAPFAENTESGVSIRRSLVRHIG